MVEPVAKVPLAVVEVKVQREECARFLVAALRVMVVTAAMAAMEAALVVEQAGPYDLVAGAPA